MISHGKLKELVGYYFRQILSRYVPKRIIPGRISATQQGEIRMGEGAERPADSALTALVDLSVESWRFSRLFARLLTKLDAGEAGRYVNQYRFYVKKLEDGLSSTGLRMVDVEGHPYDPGIAATALNVGDFGPDDELVVDQVVEPIIMGPDGLVRTGTVMLRKASE
jgi:hypothetical protein